MEITRAEIARLTRAEIARLYAIESAAIAMRDANRGAGHFTSEAWTYYDEMCDALDEDAVRRGD